MRYSLCSYMFALSVASLLCGQSTGAQSLTPEDVLDRWRKAVHASPSTPGEAVMTTSSNQDGVKTEVQEWVTPEGWYHAIVRREFDTTEIDLTDRDSVMRDWNGFLRTLRGKELSRLRAAVFESQVTVFGPPESAPAATPMRFDGDTLVELYLVAPGGDTTTWYLSSRTWMPLKSRRPGEDNEITTVYGDWRETDGLLTPFSAHVAETDKPEYMWERTDVKILAQTSRAHFEPPAAGLPDTYIQATVPPISFNFENSHIIFPLSLNGRDSVLFLLDTGADEEVINEQHLAEFGLQPYGSTTTMGGGNTAAWSFARGATFRLPGVEIRDQHVTILDESGLERALGMKLGGILGYEFISRFVVEIDYEKCLLILHDPKTWTYSGSGYTVPVTFDNGIPFTNATISVPTKSAIPAFLILDFGAAETMTLTSPFVRANDLIRLAGTNATVNKLAGLENQFFAQNNVRGRIDQLAIGDLIVKSFPANFSVNTRGAYASTNFSGTVGEGIYRRYHVFLDYARERVIFEATPESDKPYPGRRTYGLTVLASGADLRTYTVTAVRGDSPAEKDGFLKGDVITALDGKPVAQFTLGGLREALSHDKEHHDFAVKRGSEVVRLRIDVRLVSLEEN